MYFLPTVCHQPLLLSDGRDCMWAYALLARSLLAYAKATNFINSRRRSCISSSSLSSLLCPVSLVSTAAEYFPHAFRTGKFLIKVYIHNVRLNEPGTRSWCMGEKQREREHRSATVVPVDVAAGCCGCHIRSHILWTQLLYHEN